MFDSFTDLKYSCIDKWWQQESHVILHKVRSCFGKMRQNSFPFLSYKTLDQTPIVNHFRWIWKEIVTNYKIQTSQKPWVALGKKHTGNNLVCINAITLFTYIILDWDEFFVMEMLHYLPTLDKASWKSEVHLGTGRRNTSNNTSMISFCNMKNGTYILHHW